LLQLEETNRKLEMETNTVKDLLKKLDETSARVTLLQEEKKEALGSLEAAQQTTRSLEEQLKVTKQLFFFDYQKHNFFCYCYCYFFLECCCRP
jgi:hypothetical protein